MAVTLVTTCVLAMPALAETRASRVIVGFGEQRAEVFSNPHWQRLGLKHTRLVVGWDALSSEWQTREIDQWISEAQRVGAVPLLALSRSRISRRKRILPTVGQYRRVFMQFRERYPRVKTYLTWNEANHCSQPTCHRPDIAARYFDAMRSACPSCKIVAADVLDSPNMERWLRAFQGAARHKPRIWGLHNYLDANYFRTEGTRAMLRTVEGKIWFTETGGIVRRGAAHLRGPYRFSESPSRAARATRWVLRELAQASPRIRRVYLYHFEYPGPEATWDSGLLDEQGRPRPAYRVIRNWTAGPAGLRRAAR